MKVIKTFLQCPEKVRPFTIRNCSENVVCFKTCVKTIFITKNLKITVNSFSLNQRRYSNLGWEM